MFTRLGVTGWSALSYCDGRDRGIVLSKPCENCEKVLGMMMDGRRLGVLISGRGSNLQALIDAIAEARLNATIALVISNRSDAPGLDRAAAAGIETLVLEHRAFPSRAEFDRAIVAELRQRGVTLVCLAGFMRLLGPEFVAAYPNAILNIHPSLLPAFPGVDAQKQAFEHGVKVTGATVHFVTAELDAGPIVLQSPVLVHPHDTADTLSARILVEEHRLYPEAVRLVLDGGWKVVGRRVILPSPMEQTPDDEGERGQLVD